MHAEADGTHVSEEEAKLANDPKVGDGTPQNAPDFTAAYEDEDDWAPLKKRKWLPTNKWAVARVVAVGSWFTALIEQDWHLDNTLGILLVGIIVEAITAYLTPNTPPNDGVEFERTDV